MAGAYEQDVLDEDGTWIRKAYPAGLVKGARDIFVGIVGSGDYHHEMNSDHYMVTTYSAYLVAFLAGLNDSFFQF